MLLPCQIMGSGCKPEPAMGRYVGVAPEEIDEDFDFEETMRTIHAELEGLNEEAFELVKKISENFKGLEI